MHLVGFTIEIRYAARPYERQILLRLIFSRLSEFSKFNCLRVTFFLAINFTCLHTACVWVRSYDARKKC